MLAIWGLFVSCILELGVSMFQVGSRRITCRPGARHQSDAVGEVRGISETRLVRCLEFASQLLLLEWSEYCGRAHGTEDD